MHLKLVVKPYKDKTIINIGGKRIGKDFIFIAGPCSIESKEQLESIVNNLVIYGVDAIRGGAFKPRTSPYSFQGLGLDALNILKKVCEKYDLPSVSEVLDVRHLSLVNKYVDIIQIGARNMYNYPLLKEVGKLSKPILLKRGLSATLNEWLNAAEYIMLEGNENIILCERGIRTFTNHTRFTLDIAVVPSIKEVSHLPVIIDPSHPAGRSSIVPYLAKAAACVGADGLIIEVHNNPNEALSDGAQAITPDIYGVIKRDIEKCMRKD